MQPAKKFGKYKYPIIFTFVILALAGIFMNATSENDTTKLVRAASKIFNLTKKEGLILNVSSIPTTATDSQGNVVYRNLTNRQMIKDADLLRVKILFWRSKNFRRALLAFYAERSPATELSLQKALDKLTYENNPAAYTKLLATLERIRRVIAIHKDYRRKRWLFTIIDGLIQSIAASVTLELESGPVPTPEPDPEPEPTPEPEPEPTAPYVTITSFTYKNMVGGSPASVLYGLTGTVYGKGIRYIEVSCYRGNRSYIIWSAHTDSNLDSHSINATSTTDRCDYPLPAKKMYVRVMGAAGSGISELILWFSDYCAGGTGVCQDVTDYSTWR